MSVELLEIQFGRLMLLSAMVVGHFCSLCKGKSKQGLGVKGSCRNTH